MASDNVEFYERMQKLQTIQQQREMQRMSLEQEFNSYLKSDKRLNKVRASKLQSYWTKICEDERRSRARNEQLLRELDRVEAHVAALSARTDRLTLLKDQYEKQIELMYPRWQEQVEIKRRQQLLQQQKEQQQLAQQLQQLQHKQRQQQGQQQQRPEQQYPTQAQLLGQQQRHDEFRPQQQWEQMPFSEQQQQRPQLSHQQYHSSQAVNLDDDYHHLRRTSPLIPNIHVQAGTPPLLTSEDPRYASIKFGTQPPNLSYGDSTSGQEYSASLQGVRDSGSYEIPSGGNVLGGSQPRLQNGSLSNSKQEPSGFPHGQSANPLMEGGNLHVPPSSTDAGYMKLHSGIQGVETEPSVSHPRNASVYSEIRHEGITGTGRQFETNGQPQARGLGSGPEAKITQTAPTLAQQREGTSAASISSVSRAKKNIPPAVISQQQQPTAQALGGTEQRGSTVPQGQPAPQVTGKTAHPAANDDDDDSIVTPLDDEDPYLVPESVKSSSRKAQVKPSGLLKPSSERAGSAVSSKAISTARTEPFTSEDEEDEDDNTEKEALRDALEKQLSLGDDATQERRESNTASDREQGRTKQGRQEVHTEEGGVSHEKGPSQAPGHTQDDKDDEGESESDSEIGSDMSLPLSDTGGVEEPGPGNIRRPVEEKQPVSGKAQDTRPAQKVATEKVTEQGFWQLVSAVEQEIEESDNIEKIYNLPECTAAIRAEIVKTANKNGSLDHLNPNAISMVVLEQLRELSQSMPGGCLLSDILLDTKRTITEATIRSFLYSSALGFWDKLLHHLVLLIRKGVMDAEDVATMIAPLLIRPGSAMADKATSVLAAVLQDLEQQEDSQLDDADSTLPSASATPSHLSMPHQDGTAGRHQAPPEVPPLDLGGTGDHGTPELETDRVSHDSFFDDPEEPSVPLTETKAYQQMMQSSQGLAKPTNPQDSKGEGDGASEDGAGEPSSDDEEDDEIERATHLSPETPPSSRNKKRRNVLSSLGGGGSLGISYGDDHEEEEDAEGGGAGEEGGGTRRSEQMSDLISSPSPSPSPKGSGYVPSAMEQSLKSTGRSDPMQRSAAFWGEESDMEESESMSVPMGTGTLKSDEFKDDFDFYD